jgi:hypothetical protein
MSEALSGIRLLKFFNWEQNFYQKLNTARVAELGQQKKSALARYTPKKKNFRSIKHNYKFFTKE